MDFQPHGSNPDLSWQPHAWDTMQGAAAEDGFNRTWSRHPLFENRDATCSGGSYTYQRKEDRYSHYGITPENNISTAVPLCTQYCPSEFSPGIAVAAQSLVSYGMPGLSTQSMSTFVPYDQHIANTAPPGVFPAVSSPATVTATLPLTPGQHSVDNGPRFLCLRPGCAKTFGRSADLDRHFKKHMPNGAKFYCYEVGCKFNGKPFYRRDKLRSHERNMHGK